MTAPVDQLILDFAKAGASYISFHPEATAHVDRSLQLVKDQGCKSGLVFNPATPIHCLEYLLDKVDLILLMSVNPGFGGQKFLPSTLKKLEKVRQLIDDAGLPIRLQVDGGVGVDNIRRIADAGADIFVAGSAIFKSPDYAATIHAMRAELGQQLTKNH
jgi:ribulose-phosphate 3-epimerase